MRAAPRNPVHIGPWFGGAGCESELLLTEVISADSLSRSRSKKEESDCDIATQRTRVEVGDEKIASRRAS